MKLSIGPGALVAAAFIGPGTVTACTLAGAGFGFALIWALVLATAATIVLQDMAARLGAGARLGLGEALMRSAQARWLKLATAGLIVAALAVGNAAYEAGNLAGAALGLEAIAGEGALDRRIAVVALAGAAAALLLHGRYRVIEAALIGLVVLMSAAFALSAVLVRPDLGDLAAGLVPRIPEGGLLTAIALVGTTIVPYNLFLHAAAARRRWAAGEGVAAARADTLVSVGAGGLVSVLIVVTAAASLYGRGLEVASAADMAGALEPTFGPAARYLVGAGLFAAGLTSAVTAPLAAGYALAEILPSTDERTRATIFRAVALAILGVGLAASLLALQPVSLILLAQAANAIILPVVAAFLLAVMNRRALLGAHANGLWSNLAGWAVTALALGLGARGLLRAAGIW